MEREGCPENAIQIRDEDLPVVELQPLERLDCPPPWLWSTFHTTFRFYEHAVRSRRICLFACCHRRPFPQATQS